MNQKIILALILINCLLVGCYKKSPNNKTHSDNNLSLRTIDFKPLDCQIVEIRETVIKSPYNIIRLDFTCNNIVISSYDLFRENPYREMHFQMIDESTEFYTVPKNHKNIRKYGNIDFNLTGESFSKICNEIPHKLDVGLSETYPYMAITKCVVNTINSYKAIVNYYISLYGFNDTLKKHKGVVFLGGKLDVLNSKGEIEYQICAENYAITHAHIDTTFKFLTFRTTEMIGRNGSDGFQIHDLAKKELLFQFQFDTTNILNQIVYDSINYVLFQVSKRQSHFRELFLFDMHEKIIYKKQLGENYKYADPFIVNDCIVFSKYISSSENENVYIYDTLKIDKMKANDR